MKTALKNMVILDGRENMEPVSGEAILIDGETITKIVGENEIPEGYKVVDLGGSYLLPGLINLHVHIPSGGTPAKKKIDYEKLAKLLRFDVVRKVIRAMCASNARQALYAGTTTIRAVGGVLHFDTELRDSVNAGKTVGPRILAANYAVSVPGGHMTGSVALPAHSAEEAAQMVRDLVKTKPDLIKLMITGGVLDAVKLGEPGVLKMPPEYVRAATEEAHKNGLKVAAHVESTEGMLVALQNGVDTLEHGGKPTEEVIRLFKETGSVLVGTLSPAIPFNAFPKETLGFSDFDIANGKALFGYMVECIKECLASGITVGLGTDAGCPFVAHYDFWRELCYFQKYCGVTPAFAIHTATQINAKIAGVSDLTGTVEEGKSADFLIVKENPLSDLRALKMPEKVMFRGKLFHEPKVKRIEFVDRELDKVM